MDKSNLRYLSVGSSCGRFNPAPKQQTWNFVGELDYQLLVPDQKTVQKMEIF